MYKKILPLILFFFSILLCPFKSYAQNESVYIEDFNSDIVVNQDGTVDITEVITYTFNIAKHGMFREIPLSYQLDDGSKQYIDIQLLGVDYKSLNSDSTYKQYTTTKDFDTFNIKIGNPNTLIQGRWIYTIKYKVNYLIQNYINLDKLYLNILGETWEDPIHRVTATVTMPAKIEESYCYTGKKGSPESNCFVKNINDNTVEITSNKVFVKGEFLTVTATVAPDTIAKLDTEKEAFNKNFSNTVKQTPVINSNYDSPLNSKFVAWIGLFPLIIVISIIIRIGLFIQKGQSIFRNIGAVNIKKYLPNTIPQYDVPQGWYILKVATFMKTIITGPAITAQIIQLCVYGYLKIRTEGKKISVEKTSKSLDTLNKPLKHFYEGVMQNKDSVEVSEKINYQLENYYMNSEKINYSGIFSNFIRITSHEIAGELQEEGYFSKKKLKHAATSKVVSFSIILLFISFAIAMIIKNFNIILISFPLFFLIIMADTLFIQIKKSNPTEGYTKKGIKILESIHGLHMYMKTAEEERIQFHNDPQKYKGIFESLLPYAILFGMEKK